MAVTGLVMAYASIALVGVTILSVLSSLSISTIGKMEEKGRIVRGINDARQVVVAIKLYAADKGGKYPGTLEELVTAGMLEQQAVDKLQSDHRFTADDQRLAEVFASRAAVAVDLSERVTRDALTRAVEAQELERRRLARELHDEIGQDLTSLLLKLRALEGTERLEDVAEAVATVREGVVTALQDVRRLAVELRPKALDDFGLVAAVEHLVQMFSEATAIRVDLEAQLGEQRIPPEVETTLYRIIQEALTNIVKHAEASRVSILLVRSEASATVVIEDDGQGFDPTDLREDGMGIIGMLERVELHEGRLTLESTHGSGATLVVEVPL
jgi:signal transduction histidine kinase